MASVVVVVNPRSQNGALGRRWPELARLIAREVGDFEPVLTDGPGAATRLAREAVTAGADVVVAIGGDGTIHEVANGFFDEQDRPLRRACSLGVIPFGTGGDFRKTLHLPKDHVEAARVIAAGRRRTIDVGALRYREETAAGPERRRIFVNVTSFGIGGLVDKIVNESSKVLGGRASFLLGTARAALKYRNQKVRMVFDGNEDDFVEATVNNVCVANGQWFGGGMHIAPEAQLDDGLFDIVTLGDLSPWDFVKDGHRVYRGTHLDMNKISFRRARRLDASPATPGESVLLDVDGEAPGSLPASFTLLPRALDVLVP
jgi:YegS/Rv2252/BmrU family lipid kinase